MTKTISFCRATFRVESPTSVAAATLPIKNAVDLRLDRDASGAIHIPPSTFAGSLRNHATRVHGEAWTNSLFGFVADEDDGSETKARASSVWFLDSSVTHAKVEQYVATAISRHTGAAKLGTRRDSERLLAGATVSLDLRIDERLDDLIELVTTWRPVVGRNRSNGYGELAVERVDYGSVDLGTPEGLAQWLSHSGPDLVSEVVRAHSATVAEASNEAQAIDLQMQVVEPWTSDPVKDEGEDGHKTYRLKTNADGLPRMSAASQRGVLRSSISFILTTLESPLRCRGEACEHDRWECRVFGHGGAADGVGRRSALTFRESPIVDGVSAFRTRNAIDRFTGGAARGALWRTEVVTEGMVHLRIEYRSVSDADWQILLAALRLVIVDIQDGFVRFGAAVASGHGRFSVTTSTTGDPDADLMTLLAARTLLSPKDEVSAP
ncbi:RAMP superfamily CRISPR-associated protein [Aeromicrobium duanguangcaii]|uniref:RAMP superfamily CRISPR-associated protein n=1 Tax=Aeromicrobium duanguangcaii TaxID=2968086 RepID=UPI0020179C9F|nr:RAMP superfamily CRISPR-associated protein [Aeromicrobium duanguangcaii]MCL3836878.1 RAMP superfamily CRISPR-associated protein [Aeromicrobium duanguangcaii]